MLIIPRVAMRVMDGDFLTFFVWSEFSGNLFIFFSPVLTSAFNVRLPD